jgi:hypothetical protein
MRQNQQNKQRMRGRNRKGPNPLTRSFESNGPDVKIRGTALHIAEKYTQLARDASSSGDRVMAENYLQHAEHYYRIIAAAQQALQPQQFGRDDALDDSDDDLEPIGSDRFEPRQINFQNGNGQPFGTEQRGEREGGFQPRGEREGGYQPRGEGGFQPRGDREGGYQQRGEGNVQPRGEREGGYQQRDRGDREGGYQQRDRGDREGGYQQRDRGDRNGGHQPRERGEHQPRTDSQQPRPEAGFQPRGEQGEGGFQPRGEGQEGQGREGRRNRRDRFDRFERRNDRGDQRQPTEARGDRPQGGPSPMPLDAPQPDVAFPDLVVTPVAAVPPAPASTASPTPAPEPAMAVAIAPVTAEEAAESGGEKRPARRRAPARPRTRRSPGDADAPSETPVGE